LDDRVPLEVPVDNLGVHEPDYRALITFLKAMGFKTLMQRVAEKGGVDGSHIKSASTTAAASGRAADPMPVLSGRTGGQGQLPLGVPPRKAAAGQPPSSSPLTPISLAERRLEALRATRLDTAKYE